MQWKVKFDRKLNKIIFYDFCCCTVKLLVNEIVSLEVFGMMKALFKVDNL
jgi:hypothetical protein